MLRNKRAAYLLNTVFIGGLLLLLLNDHVLKATFGNALTGKLSDFAGVLILPLFLRYLTGWRSIVTIGVTVVFFTWWKSPASTMVIEFVNDWAPFHYGRVVDYTDLWAFSILPLAYRVLERPTDFPFASLQHTARRGATLCIMALASVAFIATSTDDVFPISGPVVDCCVQEPIDTTVGDGYVYIPTAFSPDGNGINDVFRVTTDSGVKMIDSVRIYSAVDSFLLFTADSLENMTEENGWAPVTFGPAESFSVLIDVWVTAQDGTSARLRNELCGIVCPGESEEQDDFEGPGFVNRCTFGTQIGAGGKFDRTVDAMENLSCF